MAFKFPVWSGFNFTSTLHSSVPASLKPENQTLPEGLVICITGASRGIGAEIAKMFAETGAAGLVLTARTREALKDTAETCSRLARNKALKISTVAMVVDSEEDVKRLASHIHDEFNGRLDVLINNAGLVSTDPTAFSKIEDMNLSQVQDIMNVNYTGRFLTTKYLLPILKTSTAKTIVDVSSIGSHFTGGGPVAYNISALAGNRLTEWIADTYGSEGVVCYSVHPGMVGNAKPPPGMPAEVNDKCGDEADLCGAFLVWLLRERPEWLSGRYLSATWDVEELVARREEIFGRDMLKMRMVV
ncbi:hypothetical protein M409DRAFT_26551 [Zasmidium cellare ATCC 36951]|uniref:Uncharacterized protein n=1 Tax=Zasmidium cellare ATCC 36951 TaxID=1080233 RepID=A0A6A6C7T9_ZASCE|nr:uncharacterized protein M409DRAFT_26551 [Zasmidium cellare ATCC 36951]KAF2163105.1 hypothetical protein M409DRAFT_26551 [Zasmidium cellare ATCC 36951]